MFHVQQILDRKNEKKGLFQKKVTSDGIMKKNNLNALFC